MLLTPRPSRTHSAITRILGVAATVSDAGVEQLVLVEVLAVEVLDAPEAAGGDGGELGALGHLGAAGAARGRGVEVQRAGGGEGAREALEEGRHCEGGDGCEDDEEG